MDDLRDDFKEDELDEEAALVGGDDTLLDDEDSTDMDDEDEKELMDQFGLHEEEEESEF